MKKLSIAVLSIILLLVIAFTALASPSTLPEDVISRLSIEYDKFEDSTSVRPKVEGFWGTSPAKIFLSVSETTNIKFCYLIICFFGDTWKFMDRCVFLVDGVRYETGDSLSSVQDIMSDGSVYEAMGFSASAGSETENIVRAIYQAASRGGVVEFKVIGKKDDIIGQFTPTQLQSWLDVYDYFNAIDKKW